MAIKGFVVMEDHTVEYELKNDGYVKVTVTDTWEREVEEIIAPMEGFFKALAIAVHPEGFPDGDKDYPEAEAVMGSIRWIP